MAFMNQERKATLAAEIKKVVPTNWKYTLAVRHHSTLVLTIRQADVDLIGLNAMTAKHYPQGRPEYIDVNEYHLGNEYPNDKKLTKIFTEIKAAMMIGNHDRSEPMTDYFDVGWYIDIKIGAFQQPFRYVPRKRNTKKSWVKPTTMTREQEMERMKKRIAELEAAAK